MVAGFLRDRLGSYDVAFYLAGIPPLIGGAMLCLIPWVEARRKRKEKAEALKQDPEVEQKMMEGQQQQQEVVQSGSQHKTGESVL